MLTRLRNILTRKPDDLPDRRRHIRQACDVAIWLFDAEGLASTARIIDRSDGGVRVACSAPDFPARAVYLLRADTGAAYRLRCAWHGPQVAGYELKGRVDGAPEGKDRGLNALRMTWAEHQAQRVSGVPRRKR